MTQKAQKRRCDGRRNGEGDLSRELRRGRMGVSGALVMRACAVCGCCGCRKRASGRLLRGFCVGDIALGGRGFGLGVGSAVAVVGWLHGHVGVGSWPG